MTGNKKGGENRMEILYEDEYIQIRLNSPHKCIEYHWKKHASIEELKNLMDKVYKFVSVHGCNKLLPDLSNLKKLPDEVRIWAESEWFPLLVKKGVRTFAIVKRSSDWTSDSVDRLYTTATASKVKLGITTAYFDDILKARSWISKLGTN